jgi:hypothetical protein
VSVSDVELILQLTKAIQLDAEKPTLDQKFNPTDPIAVMLVMYEVDYAVDTYMEKYKPWRDKFADPTVYDNFVLMYQQQARNNVKKLISEAQEMIAEEIEQEENEDDDEADLMGGT